MKEQILRIITNNGQNVDDNGTLEVYYPFDLAEEITTHVMQFVEYTNSHCMFNPETGLYTNAKLRDVTPEEIYEYYLTNVKK